MNKSQAWAEISYFQFLREPGLGIRKPTNPRPTQLKLQDLECIKVLGTLLPFWLTRRLTYALGGGAYGHVLLVRTLRDTHPLDKPGCLFAMKAVRRKYVRSCEEVSTYASDLRRDVHSVF
jgi:hypothetical protein